MKRIVKILGIVIIAALIAVMIIINNTNGAGEGYSVRVGTDKNTVAPGDSFTITLDLSNNTETSMLNGTLEYDKEKFSCKTVSATSTNQDRFSVSRADDGAKAFVFVGQDPSGNVSATISRIQFNFTVNSEATGDGTFKISSKEDFSVITSDNKSYSYSAIEGNGSTLSTKVSIEQKQTPVEPKDPTLSDRNVTLQIGESKKVTVTNGVSVTWKSDKPEVADVDNSGNISAKAAGTANITATTAEGKTATVTVTVNPKQEPTPGDNEQVPTLSETNIILYVNETKKITVTNGVTIMGWTSSNPSIAEAGIDGTITAKSVGKATITVTAENGKTATANVEVKEGTRPTDPGEQPTNPGEQPTNPGEQPTNPGEQPTNPGEQPTNPGEQPTNPGNQPTNPGEQPTNPGNQPTNPGGQQTNTSTPGTSTNYTGTNGVQGQTGNSSSTAEEEVPATGEGTVGTVIIIAIVTLIVASIIFRRKSKIK